MTVQKKHHLAGQPHLQPPSRPLSRKTVLGIAQKTSARRKDAKPPTIDVAPWEREKKDG